MNASLSERCERIRLTTKELAARAKLNVETVREVIRGGRDFRHGTLLRVADVVAKEERDLLNYLARLHPTFGASPEAVAPPPVPSPGTPPGGGVA